MFTLHHDIRHAMFRLDDGGVSLGTVSADTTLRDQPSSLADWVSLSTEESPFLLETDISVTGKVRNQLNVIGIEVNKEGEQLHWPGLVLNTVTKDSETTGNGLLGSISYADRQTGANFSLDSAALNIDLVNVGDIIHAAKIELEASQLSVQSQRLPGALSIENISLQSNANMEDEALASSSLLSMSNIESAVPVENVSLMMQSKGLVISGLFDFSKMLTSLFDDSQIADSYQSIVQAKQVFRGMVESGSAINTGLLLNNSGGEVAANFHFGVKDTTREGITADSLNNVVTGRDMVNLLSLSLSGSVNADVAALSDTPVLMLLADSPAAEFFTITDVSIYSDMRLLGTILVINDIELPLGAMMSGMLEIPLAELSDQM